MWRTLIHRLYSKKIIGLSAAASVFGKPKTNTDFLHYDGEGFKILIPSKWNPSKEVEHPGQVLRYEDNFDCNSNVTVVVTPTDKRSINDYGPPAAFISQVISLSLSCMFRVYVRTYMASHIHPQILTVFLFL